MTIFQNVAEYGPRPNWSGYMDLPCRGTDHPSPSQITMVPFIDLSPSNEGCIYSTLLYVIEETKYGLVTPSVTFDQPLWVKVVKIIHAKDFKILPRLCDFHSLMSFVGSLVMVIKVLSLEKFLKTIYAPNSVLHILSVKTFGRALRGHFLADAALKIKLRSTIFPSCKKFKKHTAYGIKDEAPLMKTGFSSNNLLSFIETRELEALFAGILAQDYLEKLKIVE